MSAIKKRIKRILYINMDEIHIPQSSFLAANKAAWKKKQKLKSLDPFYQSKRLVYNTPEELQKAVDAYFDSCYGPGYYRGMPILDPHGDPVIMQIQPFTLTGLARHLHISTVTLFKYEAHSKAGLIPPEYAEIILDAKLRIQEYAERRLYDKDGTSGARFVLEAGFGWMTKKEQQELKQSKKRIKLAQDKLLFLKETAEAGKLTDNNLVVNIMRAGEGNDD